MASKFLNLSTDTTLGGNSPSDYLAPSEKAIKTYVDNHSGGGSYTAGTGLQLDNNEFSIVQSDGQIVENFTKVGNGTLTADYLYNGTNNAYLQMNVTLPLSTANSWEFRTKYHYQGSTTNGTIISYPSPPTTYDKKTIFFETKTVLLSSNGSSWDIADVSFTNSMSSGTSYYFKFGFTGSQYYVKRGTDGWDGIFTDLWTLSSTTKVYNSAPVILMCNGYSLTGNQNQMDLKETSVIIDGSTYWQAVEDNSGEYTVAKATTNLYGLVKPDGTTVTVSDGVISAVQPTVNNATLTIQKNGTTVNTFTANASSNVTANITVPTQASDIGAQATLVSGTNIKTINNESLLGSGNISVATSAQGAKADTALQNTAEGTNSLTINGFAGDSTAYRSINIGYTSSVGVGADDAIAIGASATVHGARSIAIGGSYLQGLNAIASGDGAIQIGSGTNSTQNSLSVGWGSSNNYQLLDGTTGYIPNARINMDLSPVDLSTNTVTSGGVYTALSNKQNKLISGTNIKTVNGNSIVGSGNIDTPYRNIGEIVQSTIPLTDSGLHLLDGSLLSYGSYQAFIDYIADLYDSGNYSDIFETEANWQSSVTTYGVCGKFVYTAASGNDPATVRLPKITGFTESTTDPTVLGDLTQAGLPNITGEWYNPNLRSYQTTSSGAFFHTSGSKSTGCAASNNSTAVVNFDASRSSSIYGNASTVQPQSIKVLYYIVTANSTKTSIQVDIDEIATDLNGKADVDLTNINNTGTSKVAGWAMPSTTYSDFTIGASGASYTMPANGWLTCIGLASAAGQYLNIINADPITSATIADCRRATGSSQYIASSIPVVKGDIIIVGYTLGTMNAIRFVYAKGSESEA